MAGVKGRSGGARPNTGGARPGAGRKKKPPVLMADLPPVPTNSAPIDEPDSLRVLRAVTNDTSIDVKLRIDAAKALAPYEAMRKGEGGKKEQRQNAAKKVGTGRFAPAAQPRLVASNK